jgi:D-glucosaminate PTS system EIIB component
MIALVRVDDRLIHGQVVTQWISYTQTNIIYIVDDLLANDPIMKNMLVNLAPAATVVKVVTTQAACENMNKVADNPELKAMILTNTTKPLLEMVKAGIKMNRIVLGGMGARNDRKRIAKTVAITEAEKGEIESLLSMGLEVVCHTVPYTACVDAKDALKNW